MIDSAPELTRLSNNPCCAGDIRVLNWDSISVTNVENSDKATATSTSFASGASLDRATCVLDITIL